MIVHLLDGTYELFRHFYGLRRAKLPEDPPLGAVLNMLRTVLQMVETGATHIGVATDHIIESFRNELYAAYKTGEGIEPALFAQFHPLEEALAAMGVAVWPMVELEADDGLASSSTIGQTATPIAASASSSGWNCAKSAGSMPSPVLYAAYSSLRNDSMM